LVAAFEFLLKEAIHLAVGLGGVGKGFGGTGMHVPADAAPLTDKAVFAEERGLDAEEVIAATVALGIDLG